MQVRLSTHNLVNSVATTLDPSQQKSHYTRGSPCNCHWMYHLRASATNYVYVWHWNCTFWLPLSGPLFSVKAILWVPFKFMNLHIYWQVSIELKSVPYLVVWLLLWFPSKSPSSEFIGPSVISLSCLVTLLCLFRDCDHPLVLYRF